MCGGHSFYYFWQLQEEGKLSGSWRLRRIKDWEQNMGKCLFFSNPVGLEEATPTLINQMCPWCFGCRTLSHRPDTSFGMCGICWLSAKLPICVVFICKKSFGPHLGDRGGRRERETCKRGAEWNSGSVSLKQNTVVSHRNCCFATASVVPWQVPFYP